MLEYADEGVTVSTAMCSDPGTVNTTATVSAAAPASNQHKRVEVPGYLCDSKIPVPPTFTQSNQLPQTAPQRQFQSAPAPGKTAVRDDDPFMDLLGDSDAECSFEALFQQACGGVVPSYGPMETPQSAEVPLTTPTSTIGLDFDDEHSKRLLVSTSRGLAQPSIISRKTHVQCGGCGVLYSKQAFANHMSDVTKWSKQEPPFSNPIHPCRKTNEPLLPLPTSDEFHAAIDAGDTVSARKIAFQDLYGFGIDNIDKEALYSDLEFRKKCRDAALESRTAIIAASQARSKAAREGSGPLVKPNPYSDDGSSGSEPGMLGAEDFAGAQHEKIDDSSNERVGTPEIVDLVSPSPPGEDETPEPDEITVSIGFATPPRRFAVDNSRLIVPPLPPRILVPAKRTANRSELELAATCADGSSSPNEPVRQDTDDVVEPSSKKPHTSQ